MSLGQETVAPENLKIQEPSLLTVKQERTVDPEEVDSAREQSLSPAKSSDLVGIGNSTDMPSIESGAWSDGEAAEKVACFDVGAAVESLQAKKARVENIISTMQHTPTAGPMHANGKETDSLRRKRKQYQPQPQRDVEPETKKKPGNKKEEKRHLQSLLHHLQQQLDVLQERYQDLYDEETHSDSADSADLDDLNEPVDTSQAIRKSEMLNGRNPSSRSKVTEKNIGIPHDKAKQLRSYLKAKLSEALLNAVDSLVDNIIINPPRVKKQPTEPPSLQTNSKSASPASSVAPGPGSVGSLNSVQSIFSGHSPAHTEQTEALSLVVPSRKMPSPVVRNNNNKSPTSAANCHLPSKDAHRLATSVAIPNPSLHHPFARTAFLPALSNGYDHHLEEYR